jgi:hypothetical protein
MGLNMDALISLNKEKIVTFYYNNEGLYGYLYLNDGRIKVLNKTAIDIFIYLYESPMKLSDLLEKLSQKYKISQDKIYNPVLNFIKKLVDIGVIRYEKY